MKFGSFIAPFGRVVLGIGTLGVMGCTVSGHVNVKHNTTTNENIIEGGLKIEGESLRSDAIVSMSNGAGSFNAADVAFDVSGTTVPVPTSGNLTLSIYSDGSPTPRISSTQAWSRVANYIVFSNPVAVTAWVNQNAQTGDSLNWETAAFGDGGAASMQTISVVQYYDGFEQASSSVTFPGSGCGYVPSPEMCPLE